MKKYNNYDNLFNLLPEDDAAYQFKKCHNYKFHIPTKEQCKELIQYTTTSEYQENYRHQEAKDVEYYLKARKIVDSIYEGTSLKPKTWESFRGLYTLDKNDIGDDKCLKKI